MISNIIKIEPLVLNILKELSDNGNQCLVVGGAVRDAILGIQPKDIDIEVYKISYEDLMRVLAWHGKVDLVGKKFGVIVFRPEGSDMKYDFSVPRKENKAGTGHTGFKITFDINMTIQEAAERRDFTFNSLAYDPVADHLYDYYGGVDDLNNGIIRHTSDKFNEDYLRILRAMQFQARFGFKIHPDTIVVMKGMLESNVDEFRQLSVERVYEEWKKWAEKGIHHDLIFKFMRDTGLIECYSDLKALKETPQDKVYHPEGDVEVHTELCLAHLDKVIMETDPEVAITGNEKIIVVMATLLHDIAKPKTTEEQMKNGRITITSNNHEAMGGAMAKEFLPSIGFPLELTEPISNIITNHLAGVNISLINHEAGRIKAVKKLSRRLFPATITQLLCVMDADTNGRGGAEYKIPTGGSEIADIAMSLNVTNKQYEYILMGRHLIEAGLEPSPLFGEILSKANEAQENGEFSDIESAKKWLIDWMAEDRNKFMLDHGLGEEDMRNDITYPR